LSKPSTANSTKLIKYLKVSTKAKEKLLYTRAFTAAMFGCKVEKIKQKLKIPWTVRRVNASVNKQIMPKVSMETFPQTANSNNLNFLPAVQIP
jgi:hypothetical protein